MTIVWADERREYYAALRRVQKNLRDKVIGRAVYKGAGIVADTIQEGISLIPIDTTWGTATNPAVGLNAVQKACLHESLGISKMQDDEGFLNVKIGFSGYNDIATARWPQGQPNAMVARSVERGTSWLKSTKFIKKSVAKAKSQAVEAMATEIDTRIHALMGR